MTEFYNGLATTTLSLLERYGVAGTLTRKTETVPDPAKPHVVVQAEVNYAIRLVADDYEIRDVDGTVIQSGDRKAFVAAKGLDVVPQIHDEVGYLDNGVAVVLTIQNVKPVSPAGIPLLYECQVRK